MAASMNNDNLNKLYSLGGGYLDFSHLTELKNIYITEIYMKKKLRIIKLLQKKFMGFP